MELSKINYKFEKKFPKFCPFFPLSPLLYFSSAKVRQEKIFGPPGVSLAYRFRSLRGKTGARLVALQVLASCDRTVSQAGWAASNSSRRMGLRHTASFVQKISWGRPTATAYFCCCEAVRDDATPNWETKRKKKLIGLSHELERYVQYSRGEGQLRKCETG